ncbi:hypothetical protein NLG97_g7080 [Lecanicillium saksenae]|uniref:Uncharacterized protein n=1 Tax=Lecanicillium saksenae TaxID=468837 RepID=A0ACC1QR13_9HYPO|nr:hypothetical protein NLG97_g7080 [Lecanicillium saksenae]
MSISNESQVQSVDVVIVGDGHDSTLTSNFWGADAKTGPLQLGGADGLNGRTQQYLEIVGLLEHMKPISITCDTISTFSEGVFTSRQNEWWASLEFVLHKHFLLLGQPDIERLMSSAIHRAGVRYNDKVVDLQEHDDSVLVTCASGHRVRGRYAVGADGGRSMVRSAIGASFTGSSPGMLWAAMDCRIDTDMDSQGDMVVFQRQGQTRVMLIPRERGRTRFYVLPDGEVTQKNAEETVRAHMAPFAVRFEEIEWFSKVQVKERIASTFISRDSAGRVFLAGDAAHIHSFNGGQGLNAGIEDAFSLAWRLALVAKGEQAMSGEAATRLLCSYNDERRSAVQDIIAVAATLVRRCDSVAEDFVAAVERNAGYITGMGVCYEEAAGASIRTSQRGIWTAGRRCPDVELRTVSGSEGTRLYRHVTYGKFIIISVGKQQPRSSAFTTLSLRIDILPLSAKVGNQCDLDDVGLCETHCSKRFKASWVEEESYAVLVRPDMFGVATVDRDPAHTWKFRKEVYTMANPITEQIKVSALKVMPRIDSSYDVLVVGSGNAALVAALSARQAGARVAVFDAAPRSHFGGNSRYSSGIFRIPHGGLPSVLPLLDKSALEQAARCRMNPYTRGDYAADMMRTSGGHMDEEPRGALAATSGKIL